MHPSKVGKYSAVIFPSLLFSLLLCSSSSAALTLSLSPQLCCIFHCAPVTTADLEQLPYLHHFIQYLIGSLQIKRSNCVYESPLGFQAFFLGHTLLKSNTHTSSRRGSGSFLITFNTRPNKQTVDWFCCVRLHGSGLMMGRFSSFCLSPLNAVFYLNTSTLGFRGEAHFLITTLQRTQHN